MPIDPSAIRNNILSQVQSAIAGGSGSCTSVSSSSGGQSAIAVSLSASNDGSGKASATVVVKDGAGKAVAGAAVDGTVQVTSGGQTRTLAFPPTDSSGRSHVSVDLGQGQHGTVVWTVKVTSGGSTVTATTSSTVG
jgi:hypothetical protein